MKQCSHIFSSELLNVKFIFYKYNTNIRKDLQVIFLQKAINRQTRVKTRAGRFILGV